MPNGGSWPDCPVLIIPGHPHHVTQRSNRHARAFFEEDDLEYLIIDCLITGEPISIVQAEKLEQLCRYITRPAIANERLKLNSTGDVVLRLKSPYQYSTTHIVMSPLGEWKPKVQ
jgi:Putative transposase